MLSLSPKTIIMKKIILFAPDGTIVARGKGLLTPCSYLMFSTTMDLAGTFTVTTSFFNLASL